jgi:hypothetical protein
MSFGLEAIVVTMIIVMFLVVARQWLTSEDLQGGLVRSLA